MRYIEYVLLHVLLHHKPRTAAEPHALALADSVEPQPSVLADATAGLQLHNVARLFAQVAAYVVVVVHLAEEADTLRVLPAGTHQVFALGNLAHLVLHVMPDGEQRLLQLPVVYLCQKVRLVLHRVGAGAEPEDPL